MFLNSWLCSNLSKFLLICLLLETNKSKTNIDSIMEDPIVASSSPNAALALSSHYCYQRTHGSAQNINQRQKNSRHSGPGT